MIAATAAFVCSLAIGVAVATSDEPPTPEQLHDPIAARELVALMRTGEQQRYVARYAVVRERADGATFPATLTAAHSPTARVTRQGDSLRIDFADAFSDCQRIDDEPTCFRGAGGFGLPPSEVLQAAIAAAPYDVLQRGSANIAGEEAACFTVTARLPTRQLPEFGRRAMYCLAADGIPLRSEVEGLATERRETETVLRTFDEAALSPLLTGFEKVIPGIGR
jgi:hypothetical protein